MHLYLIGEIWAESRAGCKFEKVGRINDEASLRTLQGCILHHSLISEKGIRLWLHTGGLYQEMFIIAISTYTESCCIKGAARYEILEIVEDNEVGRRKEAVLPSGAALSPASASGGQAHAAHRRA